jgi:hypothetical protein
LSILPTASTSDRLLRVDSVTVSPGQCVFCGKAKHENGLVDTGLDFEFYGRVYICYDEIATLGSLFGLADADKVQQVEAENQELAEALIVKEEENSSLREAINVLRTLDNNRPELNAAPPNPFELISQQIQKEREVSNSGSDEGTSFGEPGTGDTLIKSNDESGSPSISIIAGKSGKSGK